jgi:hypothetical protein
MSLTPCPFRWLIAVRNSGYTTVCVTALVRLGCAVPFFSAGHASTLRVLLGCFCPRMAVEPPSHWSVSSPPASRRGLKVIPCP